MKTNINNVNNQWYKWRVSCLHQKKKILTEFIFIILIIKSNMGR